MNIKKILFIASSLSVIALTTTSCGGSGLRHEVSKTLKAYSVDLNHDGTTNGFELGGEWIDEKHLTWIEAYDTLISEANSMANLNKIATAFNIADDEIKRTSLARYEILHEAEELAMSTGTTLPIYNYGDPYLLKPNVQGISTMNLGFKFLDKLHYTNSSSKNFTVSVGTKAETFDPATNSDVSTTIATNQFLIGAKRYRQGPEEEGEEGKGIYKAVLDDGVCDVTKQLVVKTQGEEDENHIWYENCPDLKSAIDSGLEKIDDYVGTARYTIKMKPTAVWNNGQHITADDFVYEWARASSGVYNGQPFGMWCNMFDMIRGYEAWNLIGQQATDDTSTWSKTDKEHWDALSEIEQNQWKQSWQANGCAGGMAGVIRDSAEQFTVQLINDCDYFEGLLAFPAFMPVAKENIIIRPSGKTEKEVICKERGDWWMNKGGSYLTNGPLEINGTIDNIDSGGIKLKKASHYTTGLTPALVDSTTVDSIEFKFIDKDSTIYDSYKSNVIQFTNQIPNSVLDELMKKPDWHAAQQIGLFYYSFNVNDNTFDIRRNMSERDRENLRKAMILLVNRDDIANNVAKKGCTAANGFVSDGVIETCIPELRADGKIWAKMDGDEYVTENWCNRNLDAYPYLGSDASVYKEHILQNRKPGGFFKIVDENTSEYDVMKENTDLAIEYAKKAGVKYNEKTGKFVNFPRISLLTNNGSGLEDIAERMQAYYSLWGIDMSIQTQEWQAFLATRRLGDFAVARQGWVADYNDPRTYLDLCVSDSGNNDTQLGRDTWHSSH